MKKLLATTSLCLVFIFSSLAQSVIKPVNLISELTTTTPIQKVDIFTAVDSRNAEVPKEFTTYDLLSVDDQKLSTISKQDIPFLELTIPVEKGSDLQLQVGQVDIFSEDAYITLMPSNEKVKVAQGKHYRGIIKGDNSSIVAISIFENEIMGLISNDNGNRVLGKLQNQATHILYKDDVLADKLGFGCDTPDADSKYTDSELFHSSSSRDLSDCVRIYLEVDYDIYQSKGSSVSQTTDFITGLFNQVAIMYNNENINVVLSPLTIWTQPSPYNSSSSSGMLNAFLANTGAFDGDLAQLLSYKASGGIAYVNGLCSSDPDYSKSFSSINSTYANVPTYSWSVMVMTHEFGHLFGSSHTHACAWNGNNTAIDGCYNTEGSCPDPGIPSGGGTVMSYCHLTSAGINLNLGFGTQPGNLIRNKVENATCTQPCDDGGGGGGGSSCDDTEATLSILTDNYPGETTWTLKDANGATLYSGGPYSSQSTTYTTTFCLVDGCYDFQINDSYGDGICCGYGQGAYDISVNNNVVVSGGEFGSVEITNFCIGGSNPPTCSDGIQNQGETDVDCGGPNCPACPTCDDGVQNQGETDIDCGGPNCPACPTCDDGIQNQGETDVDCGGPNCDPCSGGSGEVFAHFFETGWDGWTDGGSDCYRYSGSRSYEGNYSIRIRDNSGTASAMTSSPYNLTSYSSAEINFYFYPNSMEYGEDFFIKYYNGSVWITLASFARGIDFNNNTFYVATIPVNQTMASNAQFRFQCDASSNADRIYIDAVTVTGLGGNALPSNEIKLKAIRSIAETSEFGELEDFKLSPNPAQNMITIEMDLDINQELEIITFDLLGRKLIQKRVQVSEGKNSINLDIQELQSGPYFLKVRDQDGDEMVQKFIKIK